MNKRNTYLSNYGRDFYFTRYTASYNARRSVFIRGHDTLYGPPKETALKVHKYFTQKKGSTFEKYVTVKLKGGEADDHS